MKIIKKTFNNLDEAEKFQNYLYNQYDKVILMASPIGEAGIYVWKVSN